MADQFQEFAAKFRVPELTIQRFDHWTWSLRPTHSTLGASILSLNRFCASFGSITRDEAAELADTNKEIEQRLGRAFSPQKFNYVMLMMVDPHLHFHVIPRYAQPQIFSGTNFPDSGWPAVPALGDGANFATDPVLQKIIEAIKAA